MSKSKRNVVDPNILLDQYGADTTRLFCLFAAPPQRDLEWSDQGVEGSARFLNRVWRLVAKWINPIADAQSYDGAPDQLKGDLRDLYKKTHQVIQKVSRDIEDRFHFNTAISAVMELVNQMYNLKNGKDDPLAAGVMRHAVESAVLLLSPIVPHFSEEIWQSLGNEQSVLLSAWPEYREDALANDEVTIVAQVNGKLRNRFTVALDTDEASIKKMAMEDDKVLKYIDGKEIRKMIVVPNKLVNIVV